jgi:anti-sigma regulatory factor (Ser/Thr protein kinase)
MNVEPSDIFESRFPNRPEDLSRVTEEAVRFIEEHGIGGKAVYLANLAIEEMGTNILKYGYDDTAVHEIRLRLELLPGSLRLALEDDGHEFNPLNAPASEIHLPVEERAIGGLGIHMVREMAESLDYERCGGRNRVTVTIRI